MGVVKNFVRACNFIKKKLRHRCFPMKLKKFLRALFSTENFRWLLLKLLFLFYVKIIYLLIKKKRRQKLIGKIVDKPGTLFF